MKELTPEQAKEVERLAHVFGPEELNPELAMYLGNSNGFTCIKHPLVFEILYIPEFNKRLNKTLEVKKKALAESITNKDWDRYVFLHERPYRFNALLDIVNEIEDEVKMWDLIRHIWIDSENINQNLADWKDLLQSLPGQRHFMTAEDQEVYDSLPDIVEVYHGTFAETPQDFSWTLNYDVALKFAHRLKPEPAIAKVFKARVKKSDIFAYTNNRGEEECIILTPVINPIKELV